MKSDKPIFLPENMVPDQMKKKGKGLANQSREANQ